MINVTRLNGHGGDLQHLLKELLMENSVYKIISVAPSITSTSNAFTPTTAHVIEWVVVWDGRPEPWPGTTRTTLPEFPCRHPDSDAPDGGLRKGFLDK